MADGNAHRQRAYRHWHADGIGEIALGLGVLAYVVFLALAPRLIPAPIADILGPVLAALVTFGGLVLLQRLVERLKSAYSYPRTGYVRYPQAQQRLNWKHPLVLLLLLPPLVLFIVVSTTLMLAAFAGTALNIGMLALGGMLSGAAWLTGRRTGVKRLQWVGAFLLLFGALLAISGVQGLGSLLLLHAGTGAALVCSGGITLARYLRAHDPVDLEVVP